LISKVKKYFRQKKHENILIHIGKCGGTSLRKAIKEARNIQITGVVHITKPLVLKQNYYIVARDPIDRCISAFNWRYKLVVTDGIQRHRRKGEYEVLTKYATLNAIAEELYNEQGLLNSDVATEFEKIHHLRERISFYLEDFLAQCPPNYIKGVFMQETLNQDIENHLEIPSEQVAHEKCNKRQQAEVLSKRAKINLARYLEGDYKCLSTLCHLGHIKKNTMEKIYKNARVY
jgi:hypothetical protein